MQPPKTVPGLLGVWRATVAAVEPLAVFVPALTGDITAITECEAAELDWPLTLGDAVWVLPLEGRRDAVVVIARRAI